MSTLQIKRGTSEKVASYKPLDGELLYNTETGELFVGNGVQPGGKIVVGKTPETVRFAGHADTASKLTSPKWIKVDGDISGSATFDGSADAEIKVTILNKGSANGIATLDSTGKVPADQLPSYVDDVLEFDTFDVLPKAGETGKIYVVLADNTTWRWSGTAYTKISTGEVQSVNGKKGVVTLAKGDFGLGNVDNTADKTKAVASAGKLTTPRKIGGVVFDGSADISLPGVNAVGNQSTTGNAGTATKLATARKINVSGAVSGSASFDGTADATLNVTLSNIDLGVL